MQGVAHICPNLPLAYAVIHLLAATEWRQVCLNRTTDNGESHIPGHTEESKGRRVPYIYRST